MAYIDFSKGEFQIHFKVSADVILDIEYYRCGSNQFPYLATSTTVYYPNHRSIFACGQGQETALDHDSPAYAFYNKWSNSHLKTAGFDLTELRRDIDGLKELGYPFTESADGDHEDALTDRDGWLIKQKPRRAYQIAWDTDGEKVRLPRAVTIPFGVVSETVADYLSDKYEFCVKSFKLTKIV